MERPKSTRRVFRLRFVLFHASGDVAICSKNTFKSDLFFKSQEISKWIRKITKFAVLSSKGTTNEEMTKEEGKK